MKKILCIKIKGYIPIKHKLISEIELRELVNNGTIALQQDELEQMLMGNEPVWTNEGVSDYFIIGVCK